MTGRNQLRADWENGKTAFGTFCSVPSPASAEILSRAGFDFVVLDAQHGGPTLDNLAVLIQAVELGGSVPIVRVPWHDPPTLMRVLDLGAYGVIVPMVNTADDARRVVEACRYPPEGFRSFGQHRGGFGDVRSANREVLCIVMIETAEAVENLEQVISVPGVDAVFIGPVDLSLSMGLDPRSGPTSPAVDAALHTIGDTCKRLGVVLGMPLLSLDRRDQAMAISCAFVTVGGDGAYIRRGAAADLSALRSAP